MKKQKQVDILNSEDYGLLCSIWIMASNDENEVMIYEGIIWRLGLQEKEEYMGEKGIEKINELIKKHRALFRPGVPKWRLKDCKGTWL